MLTTLKDFFYMGGHAFYVWSAYGSVLIFLMLPWMTAQRRWKNLLRKLGAEKQST